MYKKWVNFFNESEKVLNFFAFLFGSNKKCCIFVSTKTNNSIMTTIDKNTQLRFELVTHVINVLTEAKAHGAKKIREYEDKIENLFMSKIGMSYEVCRQYIDYAKTKI